MMAVCVLRSNWAKPSLLESQAIKVPGEKAKGVGSTMIKKVLIALQPFSL